MTFVQFR